MDEDKIQKQMEFIVEQQAHFASDIGQLKDVVGQLKDTVTRLANSSLQRIENLESKVSAIADAQIKTEENFSTLAEAQSKLAEAQLHTDERLNALISVFERYITKDRNGNSQG